ncbi:Minor extracellular protease vpr precursor [compost metagenome]
MQHLKLISEKPSLALMILSALLVAGCDTSKVSGDKRFNSDELDGIYSTRAQSNDPVMAILKLDTPALLTKSKRVNGKLVIDQNHLKAIQAEQKSTIEALGKISSEIQILNTYKLVLNGVSVVAPPEIFELIKSIPNVTLTEKASAFGRPQLQDEDEDNKPAPKVGTNTSVKFIGSEAAYKQGLRGQGMRVGIIDTGIDYTHKMFLGEGTKEAYKAVNPNLPNAAFPNKKVVGGIDLVGTEFNTASPDFRKRIPVPDANPLDEASHGTHVAGTVGGIGDGINTYSGVAPEADLYAIKVFGAKGSTSDVVVISALEYAADPTGDLSFSQQLDVVNLSLGSGYGSPHIMYNEAIKNLVQGGTLVVASGGNSGDSSFIVGAPGVSDDAISVASSIDNMHQNTQFPAVSFGFAGGQIHTEMVEGAITAPLAKFPALKAELVYLGLGNQELTQEIIDQTTGKIALIDRGVVAFAVKVELAQKAGAIGVLIANNTDEELNAIGGDGKFTIPGGMISKKAASDIKAQMALGPVVGDLKSTSIIAKPWLVDTISGFSSRGPRSDDGVIKPEIAAPGTNILSAQSGGGDIGLAISGTSMASPHIAGVMALLKQKYNTLTPNELKSVLLGHGKQIADKNQKTYTVSRQGAGRVQVAESLKAQLISVPSTLSFGITDLEKQKTLTQEITLKNISSEPLTLTPEWKGSAAFKVSVPSVTLAAGESKTVTVTAKIVASLMKTANDELDGYLKFNTDKGMALQMPGLVLARQISQISAGPVVIAATSEADAAGSKVQVEIKNKGLNPGSAYLFNLLGTDPRKKSKVDPTQNRNCDLQSAGYRVVEKDGARILQVAVKLYEGLTTWHRCEANVQIDSNNDNLPDQEIAGIPMSDGLPGLTGTGFVSLLLDGNMAREIRKKYEVDSAAPAPQDPKEKKEAKEDYANAIVDARKMETFDGSTLAIIEADISLLALGGSGDLNIKVSTTHQDAGAVEGDNYLAAHAAKWSKISVNPQAQSYTQIPEKIELKGQETVNVSLQKGYGTSDLILYAPQNKSVRDFVLEDTQSQILPTTYAQED